MKIKMLVILMAMAGAMSASAAPVTFNFVYQDAAGAGFNDASLGSQRKAALELAGQYWGSLLSASYAGETINLGVSFNPSSTSLNPLSSSGATNLYANAGLDNKGLANVAYVAPLAEHLAGRNLNGSSLDYTLSFNGNLPTYLGLDGNPGANEYDFFSYSLRAVGRTLGIYSRVDRSATATQGEFLLQLDPATNTYKRMPSIYDTFITNGQGDTLMSMTRAQRVSELTAGILYWNGVNAIGQHGGTRPEINTMPLNADGTINGNSIVYLDSNETTLMTYLGIQQGETMGLDTVTAGMLKDMGWTLSVPLPVPEPSTYAMLLAGLGLMGFAARRRKS